MELAIDNVKGRTTAFGTVSQLRGAVLAEWTRAVLGALGVLRLERRAQKLAFLHYAHWVVIGRRPLNRLLRHRGARARGPYLVFLSQFTGDWDDYLAAFGRVLDDAVDAAWGQVEDWPGATRLAAFFEYVERHELESQAFYQAYAPAGPVEVRAALHARDALERFFHEIDALDGDVQIRDAYNRLLWGLRADLAA